MISARFTRQTPETVIDWRSHQRFAASVQLPARAKSATSNDAAITPQ
jgi:hypothetical protein